MKTEKREHGETGIQKSMYWRAGIGGVGSVHTSIAGESRTLGAVLCFGPGLTKRAPSRLVVEEDFQLVQDEGGSMVDSLMSLVREGDDVD